MWHWLTSTDAGLATRIALGGFVLLALALHDLHKRRHEATRWREYAFLLACTVAAMAYGALNDQVTSAISWEYFYYGKGLAEQLGPRTPPDPVRLHLHAALVGVKATWTAGLIIGACFLVANNPSKRRPHLPGRALARHLLKLLLITLACSALGAWLGSQGVPARWNEDFAEMLRRDEMRPRRFMTVYGIHLGAYVGGAVATPLVMLAIHRQRRLRARG
jgi:hypothetical protein